MKEAAGDLLYLFGTIFAVSFGVAGGVVAAISFLLAIARLGQKKADDAAPPKHSTVLKEERDD